MICKQCEVEAGSFIYCLQKNFPFMVRCKQLLLKLSTNSVGKVGKEVLDLLIILMQFIPANA